MEVNGLYVVGTPIGNLGDISARAVHVLSSVDFIAAEDTRVTGLLLSKVCESRAGVLVSYHEHNVAAKTDELVRRIQGGESCAIVTDAGMPCISDPGEVLVRRCREVGVAVYAVPGACAVTTALAVSGMSAVRYTFEGFLPPNKRAARLEPLKCLPHTLVFYEAPHKLKRTLADLREHLGDRRVALCRELTKLYEEVELGALSEVIARYESKTPRGEYVIIVEGAAKPPKRVKVNKYPKEG
ncbi:MAG: 16S rRNA (cytidine(1402)-2'-O)-methyltransferase [Oscillospiraceae bacterium]|nr:16S rRNA (cytidine(1402)-2'-O)-methyltransferase [Oscillospiraceae bacterium]